MPRYRVVRTVELKTSYYVNVADSYTSDIFEVVPNADPLKEFWENDGKRVYMYDLHPQISTK